MPIDPVRALQADLNSKIDERILSAMLDTYTTSDGFVTGFRFVRKLVATSAGFRWAPHSFLLLVKSVVLICEKRAQRIRSPSSMTIHVKKHFAESCL